MQKHAPELHNRHLWDQENAAEISGNNKTSKEIKQLLYIENSRQKHRKVDYYFKEKLDCSMDTIKIETRKNGIIKVTSSVTKLKWKHQL